MKDSRSFPRELSLFIVVDFAQFARWLEGSNLYIRDEIDFFNSASTICSG